MDNKNSIFYFIGAINNRILKTLGADIINRFFNIHKKGNKRDIFIFGSRRSGTTWLMELIGSQPGIKYSMEPLNIPRWHYYKNKLPRKKHSKFINLNKKEKKLLKTYFSSILEGSINVGVPCNIFNSNFNFITNRTVLKTGNSLPLIDWFEDNFDIYLVYLVRHPIPTALSIAKQGWPDSISAYLDNKFFRENYLNERQLRFSLYVKNHGTILQHLVLEWCLENLVPLNLLERRPKDWLIISYEELVYNSKKIVELLYNNLHLQEKNSLGNAVLIPSKTTTKKSREYIKNWDKKYLINRWRKQVSIKEQKKAFRVLSEFGLTAYRYGSIFPEKKLINFPEDIEKIQYESD